MDSIATAIVAIVISGITAIMGAYTMRFKASATYVESLERRLESVVVKEAECFEALTMHRIELATAMETIHGFRLVMDEMRRESAARQADAVETTRTAAAVASKAVESAAAVAAQVIDAAKHDAKNLTGKMQDVRELREGTKGIAGKLEDVKVTGEETNLIVKNGKENIP